MWTWTWNTTIYSKRISKILWKYFTKATNAMTLQHVFPLLLLFLSKYFPFFLSIFSGDIFWALTRPFFHLPFISIIKTIVNFLNYLYKLFSINLVYTNLSLNHNVYNSFSFCPHKQRVFLLSDLRVLLNNFNYIEK